MSEVEGKPRDKSVKRDYELELEKKDKKIKLLEEEVLILKKSIVWISYLGKDIFKSEQDLQVGND